MTTPNDNQMASAKRKHTLTTTSSDGKWKTFLAHAGLMQYIPSGVFYARAKVDGIVKRASLETDIFTTAKDRLALKIKEMRKPVVELGTFKEARLLYVADMENDHAISDETKRYWNYRIKALLKSWPELDDLRLSAVTETACRVWAKQYAEQFDETNFNNTLAVLRNILKRGGLRNDDNPAMKLKRLGSKPKKLALPEADQFETIIRHVETAGARQSRDCANFIRFLAFSGCRIAEARKVLWSDVDFDREEIRVHSGKQRKTTNGQDVRYVPIIPPMLELLTRLKKDGMDPAANVCQVGECEKSLTRGCELAGTARITHHDLRHLFATRCIESGVDIPTVSRWLGHRDGGALAMKTYGHLRREHSQSMASRVTFGIPVISTATSQPLAEKTT